MALQGAASLRSRRLVLASASPRRQELLRNAGIAFEICAANIQESPLPGELPQAHAERLAREKAQALFIQYPHDFILGADTIVVIENEILGKPRDEQDAARMLRLLSGRTHHVITGVCLLSTPTSRLANPWTKQVRTPSRAYHPTGSLGSKVITSTWWDYQ